MNDSQTSEIRLSIPSQPEYVGVVRLAAAGIAHRLELNVEEADDLKLAVTEACARLLERAGPESPICVDWSIGVESLVVTVHCESVSEASGEAEWSEIGLFLIHALMDEVSELDSAIGLRMVKYFHRNDNG